MLGVKRRPWQNLGDVNFVIISSTCESWKWTQARNTTQRWGKLIVVMDVKFLRLWWNGGVRKLKMKKYKDSEWWLWELPEAVSWYPVKIKPNNTAQWSKKKPYCYFLICEPLPWIRNCNRINMHRRKMNELQKLPCNSCKKIIIFTCMYWVWGTLSVLLVLIMLCEALGEVLHRGRRSDDDCVSVRLSVSAAAHAGTSQSFPFVTCQVQQPPQPCSVCVGVGGRPGASCTMVPPLLGRRRLIMHEDILS